MKKTLFFFGCFLWSLVAFAQNNALDFDGVDDEIIVGDITQLNQTNQFTIEGWFKQDAIGVKGGMFAKILDGTNMIRARTWSNGQLYTYVYNGANPHARFDYSSMTFAGSWFHYAMVFDGTQSSSADRLKVYFNGQLMTLTFNNPIPNQTANLTGTNFIIGEDVNVGGAGQNWNGQIDEVRVWNIARTAAQISANMNNELSCSTSGLIACYHFNQGIAGGNNAGVITLNDGSSNNYDGTLSGFALTGSSSNWVERCMAPSPASFCVRLRSCPQGAPTVIDWADAMGAAFYVFAGSRNCGGTPCAPSLNRLSPTSGFTFPDGAPNNFPVFITLTTACADGSMPTTGMFPYTLSMSNCNSCPLPGAPPIDVSELEEVDISPLFVAYKDVNVYPNPANDILNVELLFELDDDTILEVMDISGKVVKTERITDIHTQLDISELGTGNYMMRIQSGSDSITKSFVRIAQN